MSGIVIRISLGNRDSNTELYELSKESLILIKNTYKDSIMFGEMGVFLGLGTDGNMRLNLSSTDCL